MPTRGPNDERQEAELGPAHPRIAQSLTGLANELCVYWADPSVRRDLYLRALVILDVSVGPNATARAAVMCDIAGTYQVLRGPQPSHHPAESLRWYQAAAEAARSDPGDGRVLAEAVRGVADAVANRRGEASNAQRMLEGILTEGPTLPATHRDPAGMGGRRASTAALHSPWRGMRRTPPTDGSGGFSASPRSSASAP